MKTVKLKAYFKNHYVTSKFSTVQMKFGGIFNSIDYRLSVSHT